MNAIQIRRQARLALAAFLRLNRTVQTAGLRVAVKNWLVLAALALSACTAASAADAPSEIPAEWVQVDPEAVRIDGRLFDPTCSQAPGADPTYRFWYHHGAANGLVVFFDGGGACWDDVTCAIPRLRDAPRDDDGFYKAELIDSDDPRRFNGIFDLDNPRNPVRDWSFVYVPYCTGDVHSGSNTAHYTDPDTGAPYAIEHRGADNFRVILDWMKHAFVQPEQVLVAGSSAGAYGAATHYARIRQAYPRAQSMMIGDAGQGVMTQAFLDRRQQSWGFALPRGVLARNAAVTPETDIVAALAARYPNDRFAQYTTARDITQTSFYALMGAENACNAWSETMSRALAHRQRAPNFRSYLARGETHAILRTARFYTETSGGGPLPEWLGAMLEGGPGWENRACQECMAAATRCLY
ncbi:MAG: pectin acetylesterase-family hydrolase [Hyphomonadaceae bacterium]